MTVGERDREYLTRAIDLGGCCPPSATAFSVGALVAAASGSTPASRPRSCAELILATVIPRIVFAWREPDFFVGCEGAELLRAAGREVVEISDLAYRVRRTNAHLRT